MLRDLMSAAALAGLGWIIYRLEHDIMANFDALNAKLDEQDTARAAAVDRINADIQALRDQIAALELDEADQANVDAVTERLQGNIDALNTIDPVRATPEDGEPAPEETPADGGNA